jgi:glycosyl transferase family 87
VNYLAYVPFEQVFPYHGEWDDLPAAHAAAIAFDTLTMIGLMLLGAGIRPGPGGRRLGLALAFAWAAYPYTLYAMNTGTNDSLVAALLVFALVAASSPLGRGALVGAAAMVKFAPLLLVPLMVRGTDERIEVRRALIAAGATLAVCAVSVLALLPDGGLREFYDATVGFQLGAESPFGIWGQVEGLGALQSALKAGTCALAVALFWRPALRTTAQLSALAAALLIATQMAGNHWIYLYIVWFAPLVLAALFAEVSEHAPPRSALRTPHAPPKLESP